MDSKHLSAVGEFGNDAGGLAAIHAVPVAIGEDWLVSAFSDGVVRGSFGARSAAADNAEWLLGR
jgi:hypothetical protein